jgi:flagellar hook-length control protein FliK
MLQNVATEIEQPGVIAAPPVEKQAGRVTTEPLPATPVQPAEKLAIKPFALLADEHAQPLLSSDVAATVPAAPPQTAKYDRMLDVNKPTPLPVDQQQNAANPAASEPPPLFSATPEKIQATQTVAEPVQSAQLQTLATLSAKAATVPAPDERIVQQRTKTADLTAIPTEKPATESISLQSERPSTQSAAAVLADNRSAALVQEIRGVRQRLNPGQMIEKVRPGTEQGAVKEMTPSLQVEASVNESTLGPDTPNSNNSNQEQPDVASDSRLPAQDMRGQITTEHQRVATFSNKAVPTDSVRQDIPEQVMQQVKERLVQHDVKPGNQQITLTLSPDSLGELKMNLNLQGQKLSVEIVTENRAVRDAIVQHTDALKESLARQNITMESFDVTTGGKGSGNQGQNQNAWRELAKQQQQQQFWTPPHGYHAVQADVSPGQTANQRQQGQSMLDIHY